MGFAKHNKRDGRMEGRTDTAAYRDARTHLKMALNWYDRPMDRRTNQRTDPRALNLLHNRCSQVSDLKVILCITDALVPSFFKLPLLKSIVHKFHQRKEFSHSRKSSDTNKTNKKRCLVIHLIFRFSSAVVIVADGHTLNIFTFSCNPTQK